MKKMTYENHCHRVTAYWLGVNGTFGCTAYLATGSWLAAAAIFVFIILAAELAEDFSQEAVWQTAWDTSETSHLFYFENTVRCSFVWVLVIIHLVVLASSHLVAVVHSTRNNVQEARWRLSDLWFRATGM
jgi:hypothetical protein